MFGLDDARGDRERGGDSDHGDSEKVARCIGHGAPYSTTRASEGRHDGPYFRAEFQSMWAPDSMGVPIARDVTA